MPKPIVKSRIISKDTILSIVTERVGGQLFTIACTNSYSTYVLNSSRDTIFKIPEFTTDLRFIDFDGDGYKDITMDYQTHIPGIRSLLLYDKNARTYREVKDFNNFPAAERVAHTRYYYSYAKAGCADSDWESKLFYIRNFKIVKIGVIAGLGCGLQDAAIGIHIYRYSAGKKNEIKQYPIGIIKKYKSYKWGFIKSYWEKNYSQFL